MCFVILRLECLSVCMSVGKPLDLRENVEKEGGVLRERWPSHTIFIRAGGAVARDTRALFNVRYNYVIKTTSLFVLSRLRTVCLPANSGKRTG